MICAAVGKLCLAGLRAGEQEQLSEQFYCNNLTEICFSAPLIQREIPPQQVHDSAAGDPCGISFGIIPVLEKPTIPNSPPWCPQTET